MKVVSSSLLLLALCTLALGAYTSVNDFVPKTLAVGFHHHAVWAEMGSSFGTIGKDVLDKLAAKTGMNGQVIRIDVAWPAFETSKGKFAGRPYNGKMEDTLNYLRTLGKKALIVLCESPTYTHPGFTSSTKTLPDDPASYAGIGKWFHEYLATWNDVLVGVEVFNEPNLAGSSGFDRSVDTPRPAHYADCLAAYYNAAKASSNPYLPVVFGAPESVAVDPTKDGVSPRTNYIGMAYDHIRTNRGGKMPWDVMAVHIYPVNNQYTATTDYCSFYTHLKALQARMVREGDKSPIYITETGHSAHDNVADTVPWFTGVSEAIQASYTVGDINGVLKDHPNIKVFIVYNDVMKGEPSSTTDQRDRHEFGFGILRYSTRATTKPIYGALKDAINGLPNPFVAAATTTVKPVTTTTKAAVTTTKATTAKPTTAKPTTAKPTPKPTPKPTTAKPTPKPTAAPICVAATTPYQVGSYASQSAPFTFTVQASSTVAGTAQSWFGLSQDKPLTSQGFATLIRFHTTGVIQAWSGAVGQFAAKSSVVYKANTLYTFVITVDVKAKTYNVTSSAAGSAAVYIAFNYKFRAQAATLGWYGFRDNTTAHNIKWCPSATLGKSSAVVEAPSTATELNVTDSGDSNGELAPDGTEMLVNSSSASSSESESVSPSESVSESESESVSGSESSAAPTDAPVDEPTDAPSDVPTDAPTDAPTDSTTVSPTASPSGSPSASPSAPSSTTSAIDASAIVSGAVQHNVNAVMMMIMMTVMIVVFSV